MPGGAEVVDAAGLAVAPGFIDVMSHSVSTLLHDGLSVGTVLSVAAGGALGAAARYGLGGWVQQLTGSDFPWGTLLINVTGSLALGFLVVWLQAAMASPELRAFLTVGVLGGFTTFSTLSYETVAMVHDGEMLRAGTYAAGSLALGVAAAFLGMALAQQLLRGPA